MPTAEMLSERLRELLRLPDDQPLDAEALIGLLQRFRPDGLGLADLFTGLPRGPELNLRLAGLYQVAGDSRRLEGGQDAYFIVRNPPPLEPEQAVAWAEQWLRSLRDLARAVGVAEDLPHLQSLPEVRVLEGLAPKQLKADLEAVPLYRTLKQDAAGWAARLPGESGVVELLGPAYYYAACDWALRDHLLWPLYADGSGLDDPFAPYFDLWRHGAKWRAFSDDRVDVYLPHRR